VQWLASLIFTLFLFLWTAMYAVLFSVVAVLMSISWQALGAGAWLGQDRCW